MAEQLILKNLDFIKVLPYWAQDLSYKYCSKTTNLYIVHGNIRDFLPNKMYEGEFVFVRIQEFISESSVWKQGCNCILRQGRSGNKILGNPLKHWHGKGKLPFRQRAQLATGKKTFNCPLSHRE